MRAALSANVAMIRFRETTTQRDRSFKTNIASCTSDAADTSAWSSPSSLSEQTETCAGDTALDCAG